MAYKDSSLRIRPVGEDRWSSPDRDIIELWPSALVRGAAFVCAKNSDLNDRLRLCGLTEAKVREQLIILLGVVNATKHGPLYEAIKDRTDIDADCFQLIMAGAGSVLFKDFNYYYRSSQFTDASGGTRHPMEAIDIELASRIFDKAVAGANE